jgi:hypothetical protein
MIAIWSKRFIVYEDGIIVKGLFVVEITDFVDVC